MEAHEEDATERSLPLLKRTNNGAENLLQVNQEIMPEKEPRFVDNALLALRECSARKLESTMGRDSTNS